MVLHLCNHFQSITTVFQWIAFFCWFSDSLTEFAVGMHFYAGICMNAAKKCYQAGRKHAPLSCDLWGPKRIWGSAVSYLSISANVLTLHIPFSRGNGQRGSENTIHIYKVNARCFVGVLLNSFKALFLGPTKFIQILHLFILSSRSAAI